MTLIAELFYAQGDVSNSASSNEMPDLHANALGDANIRSSVPGAGMKVKEYFINFDSGDALGMMSPYMASCAHTRVSTVGCTQRNACDNWADTWSPGSTPSSAVSSGLTIGILSNI